MTKVLVLGAGLVSRPLVHYLLKKQYQLTIATRTVSKAEELIRGFPNGRAVAWVVDDLIKLEQMVRDHDLSVSLLPAPLHPVVAEMCIRHRKHMVTTSYVSPKMREMDKPAQDAGVVLLNEIGVDPGIDHMSAMRIIHDVQKRGGRVVSFRSYCGGLPAPEANNNPWGYKFSWSPRGVCTAGKNPAKFLEYKKLVEIPGPELFTCNHPLPVEGVGTLEAYPNRDSLGYLDIYGLKDIDTMFRGTLRYAGWCACLKKVVDFGCLDETPVTYPVGTTFSKWTAGLMKSSSTDRLREQVARHLKSEVSANYLDRWEWLGLFSNDPLPITSTTTTALDELAQRMEKKMVYAPSERDMIALVHHFEAEVGGQREKIVSSLVDYGIPHGDSSMARTVSLPAAIGVDLILSGRFVKPGVHIPVMPELYNPVLDELANLQIRCQEKTRKL
ncbi:MAG: hypothetical protein HJJLKODD_02805 [Phycisphaerae bacterium]|nr:hypothetical protein [Phycisphaerae bacterium]